MTLTRRQTLAAMAGLPLAAAGAGAARAGAEIKGTFLRPDGTRYAGLAPGSPG